MRLSKINTNTTVRTNGRARGVLLALAALVAVTMAMPVFAQAETPPTPVDAPPVPVLPAADRVAATLTPAEGPFTVGDPIELSLEVVHPDNTGIIVPQLETNWGDLEVRSQGAVATVDNGDGTLTTHQTIEVALFAPGEFQTPLLAVTVSDTGGALTQAMAAPASLTVASILADGDETLRDIKPQADLPLPATWPQTAVLAMVALVIVVFLAWWVLRRRRGRTMIDNRPPEQVAYDELDHIQSLNLPAAGRYDTYYALVADTLRTYLERQYGLPARDRTTAEIDAVLGQTIMATVYARTLIAMLDDCDLVKFAHILPSETTAQMLLEDARRFVAQTTAEKNAALAALQTGDAKTAALVDPAGA